jgi:hypothetical protein
MLEWKWMKIGHLGLGYLSKVRTTQNNRWSDHLLQNFFALCSILAIFWGLQMTVDNTRFILLLPRSYPRDCMLITTFVHLHLLGILASSSTLNPMFVCKFHPFPWHETSAGDAETGSAVKKGRARLAKLASSKAWRSCSRTVKKHHMRRRLKSFLFYFYSGWKLKKSEEGTWGDPKLKLDHVGSRCWRFDICGYYLANSNNR